MSQKKILFVCLGNICRSPLAEAIFKHKINELGLADWYLADSCGTSNYHVGDEPDPRTIRNASKNGVSVRHTGRQLQEDDLDAFDLILAMDENNYHSIFRLPNARSVKAKIKLIREFDPLAKGENVPDPYYGSEKDFQQVFDILDRTIENFITQLDQVLLKPEA
ncbi:MAG: low molecular weight phosphotyrosine protein phosphatase [Flammeovirgaceae bacterium]|nr:low molecular weight phosphotyrosine protein phosphatase [Flammeovirgaceae bacterium]